MKKIQICQRSLALVFFPNLLYPCHFSPCNRSKWLNVIFGWTSPLVSVLFEHKDTALLCSSTFIHSLVMILLGWGLNGNRLSGMWCNRSAIPNGFRTNVDLDSRHEMLKLQSWEEHDAAYWWAEAGLGLKWKQCVLIVSYWPGLYKHFNWIIRLK